MSQDIYRFILRHSWKSQLLLLALTLCSFPFLYYSLELPKQIINNAIDSFDPATTAILGYSFTQIEYLMLLSGLFLTMVVLNGVFKYYINTFKGRLGERMLRRLRYELYARALRFPLGHFKKLSSGEVISMITIEVEPLGGFIGESFAQPAFQGGTLLIYVLFIFIQDPYLGIAAVILYPFQGFLISRLQQRVNQLGKQRVRTVRQVSTKIGEHVMGIQEIHTHDMSLYHKADLSFWLGKIFNIRHQIYQRKFMIKFINNFINQLTPFFFYSIGGYLVIVGELSFGSLVAVLAAYKDMAGPWRELLVYYQLKEDSRIKYKQVIEQFQPPQMLDPALQEQESSDSIGGDLELINVTFEETSNYRLIESFSARIDTAGIAMFIGNDDEYLPLLLARLLFPTDGSIMINGKNATALPESVTGRRIGYIGQTPYLFSGSVSWNILYGIGQRPAVSPFDRSLSRSEGQALQEAYQTDNSPYFLSENWFHAGAYYSSEEELSVALRSLLDKLDLSDDLYELGLRSSIQAQERPDLVAGLLQARREAQNALNESAELKTVVLPFDQNVFNRNAMVLENLLFGTALGDAFSPENAAKQPYLRATLDQTGLTSTLVAAGYQVAQIMVEIFSDVSVDSLLFERFSFIHLDDLPLLESLLFRVSAERLEAIEEEDKVQLLSLAFKLTPNQHRLGIITPEIQERIIGARRAFIDNFPPSLADSIEFFDFDRYNNAATIRDNILFGRLLTSQAQSVGKELHALIGGILDRMGLRDRIIDIGMEAEVGVGGSRLSAIQRQKVAIARVLLKKPDLLIVDRATASFDSALQRKMRDLFFEACRDRGLIWFVHDPTLALKADRVFILSERRLIEEGTPEELLKNPESALTRLCQEG